MSKTWIFSDLHLGVQRSGGTTPATAEALREYGHRKHAQLLSLASDGDTIIINGDLTDTFNIDLGQAIEVYSVAASWLTANPHGEIVWATGNHDLSKDSSKLGTVAFVGKLLEGMFPGRFHLVTRATRWGQDFYIIPHVANQDLFDLELSKVPDNVKHVLLHCNYDNTFAGQSDHSLNISRDQAKALVKSGKTLILGHEHQGRTLMNDKVVIVGNQFPASVSDCLSHGDAQADGFKYALVIAGDDMELVPTWNPTDRDGGFREISWRDLASLPDHFPMFVRVTGTAGTAEAPDVIKAISTLRQRCDAYVITNAVKVDAVDGAEEIEVSIEEIRSVDVIELLLGMLDEEQQAVVRNLMKEEQQ